MSGDQATTEPVEQPEQPEQPEHPDYEALLTGVVALANLFSNCVHTFGLVHPGHKWEKQEQLAICRLGVQQARLLIWGDVVGVTSPPASVTDRAIPKHPSSAYPDLKEPTFFVPRDSRLDEPDVRTGIENALSALVDRSASTSREEMMEKYGLKVPKRYGVEYQSALDTNRLEAFREKYELLKEVAESYAQIDARRNASIVSSTWQVADFGKFGGFIKLTQEKIDFLIEMMDIKERVDQAMRMDIKALGWHLSADRARIAADSSKLRLIQEACKVEYPEYLGAVDTALANIERERRENVSDYNPYTSAQFTPVHIPGISKVPAKMPTAKRGSVAVIGANGSTDPAAAAAAAATEKHRRSGVFGGLFKFGRKSQPNIDQGRSFSVADASTDGPERSLSEGGPMRSGSEDSMQPPEYLRSKSVGDILDAPINDETDQAMLKDRLEKLNTNAADTSEIEVNEALKHTDTMDSAISRHDMYHGLGRQGTRSQW